MTLSERVLHFGSILFAGALLLAFPGGAAIAQTPPIEISGQLDTSRDAISLDGVTITINGTSARLDENGRYSAELDPQPYYQVQIAGDTIFKTIQTFGHMELLDKACACLKAGPIDLVAKSPGRVELFFAGDAMAGRRYSEPIWGERKLVDRANAYPDLMKLLNPIRPYVESADLASVNLEIVLADKEPGASPPKSVVFYSPPELANALADTGFDYVSLGNNHSYDFLEAGLHTTIRAIEDAKLAWSGAGFDEEQALQAARLDAGNAKLSLLGYVGWKGRVEPNQVAEDNKGGAALGSTANIVRTVEREVAAGRLPIVQLHGSREYSDGPTKVSESRMRAAIDAGAVVVASHHPHVTQGIEIRGGKIIAYSLGNFLFDQYFMLTHASYAMKVWLEDGKPIRLEIIPLRILDYRPVPAVGSTRSHILDRVTRLSAPRGTRFYQTGGHLALRLDDSLERETSLDPANDNALVYWGDFENSRFGDARDRTIEALGARIHYHFDNGPGTRMRVEGEAQAKDITVRPTTFFRKTAGETLRISARIKTPFDFELDVLAQQRPPGMGRFDALKQAPFKQIGTASVPASRSWQRIELSVPNLKPVDGKFLPMRTALRFRSNDEKQAGSLHFELDDLTIKTVAD